MEPPADPSPLEELFARLLPALDAYVRARMDRLGRGDESPSDLVQSVCHQALRDLPVVGPRIAGEQHFRNWLRLVARRKLADCRRREAHSLAGGQAGVSAGDLASALIDRGVRTPSREAAIREETENLRAALARLPERLHRVIELVHFQGRTHAEVANEIGCSKEATRSLLYRAKARLAALMPQGHR